MTKTLAFVLERTTKGALRYAELGPDGAPLTQADAVVGTLYVRKSALTGQEPSRLTVTIDLPEV